MKAIVMHAPGAPQVLSLADVPPPEIAHDTDLLVRLKAPLAVAIVAGGATLVSNLASRYSLKETTCSTASSAGIATGFGVPQISGSRIRLSISSSRPNNSSHKCSNFAWQIPTL